MTVTSMAPRLTLDSSVVEQVLLSGDLSKLSPEQRLSYYNNVCASLGLNPLTKPFAYITLNGKLQLYALKDATEQLRKIHQISVTIKAREVIEGCYVVTAQARMPSGREDESIGAVPIANVQGENRSNAMMKAETKAKRRVTLSICGLGMLDETEVESIPGARVGDLLPTIVANHTTTDDSQVHTPPIRARIVDVQEESKKGKLSGETYTKTTVTLSTGQVVTTLDAGFRQTIKDCLEDGSEVDVTTRETRWGTDIVTIARLPPEGSDDAF